MVHPHLIIYVGYAKKITEFLEFKSMAWGYRTAWRILFNYFYRFVSEKKPFNVTTIIHRWAPPCENDTQSYIGTILRLTGLGG